jgi:hypothetical protein
MKKKMKKAEKQSGSIHVAAEPQQGEATFSRWALFEKEVLAKVKDPEKCKAVIAQRQAHIDDDSHEADLVAAYIRLRLCDERQNPDSCCFFFTTAEITTWLQQATGTKLPINKATPFLRHLSIPELTYSKKNGVPGWVWRGRKASKEQKSIVFSKLRFIPPE